MADVHNWLQGQRKMWSRQWRAYKRATREPALVRASNTAQKKHQMKQFSDLITSLLKMTITTQPTPSCGETMLSIHLYRTSSHVDCKDQRILAFQCPQLFLELTDLILGSKEFLSRQLLQTQTRPTRPTRPRILSTQSSGGECFKL